MTTRLSLAALVPALLLTSFAALSPAQTPAPRSIRPPSTPKPIDLKPLATANTLFATDLYTHLAPTPGNIFFSPYSISSALAMTSAGARGNTETQMAKTLRLTLPPDQLHPAFSTLTATLNQDALFRPDPSMPSAFELVVANALWSQQGYPFNADFQTTLKTNYGSELQTLDFNKATEQSRVTINRWVATQTKDKIQDLLAPGILQPVTRLVLTNAIYFKSNWAEKFQKAATADKPFHLSANQITTVPLMHQMRSYNYFETPNAHLVELPYFMNRLSMVLIVPKEITGLPAVEKELPGLPNWLGNLKSRRVDLFLPRFKTTSSFSLKTQLEALGMTDAFDPKLADFSAMTAAEKLFISAVIHKAYVDVNEEGTEAAAATAVAMAGGAMPSRDEPVVVKADRPFLFLIRHASTGTILFLGRFASPEAAKPATIPTPAARPPARATPAPIEGRPANPNAATNTFIVMLDPTVDVRAEVTRLESTYNFRSSYVYTAALRGFAAPLTNDQAQKLRWEPSVLQLEYDQSIRLGPPGGPQ